MTIALNWHNPPTAIAIVALQEVGLVCGGSKDIVAQILYWLATIGRAHTVATTAKEKPLPPLHHWLASYRLARLSR